MNTKSDSDIVHCDSPTDIVLPWLCLCIEILQNRFYFCILVCKVAKNYQIHLKLFTNIYPYKINNLRKFYENWTSILKVIGWSVKYLTDYLTVFSSRISRQVRKCLTRNETFFENLKKLFRLILIID